LSFLSRIFSRTDRRQTLLPLYQAIVALARDPAWYGEGQVPDSIDGRFDLVALHAWLMLAGLKAKGEGEAAQGLTDTIFTGFDEAMREQGAGDMGLSRKMKAFADAFYGRLAAYEAATDEDMLAQALAKNLWRGADVDARARALAAYALRARQSLAVSLPDALDFGPLPAI